MKYEIIEKNGLHYLIKSDEENFKKELVAQGKTSGNILKNVIYFQSFGGCFGFCFLNEDKSEIKLTLEKVDEYAIEDGCLLYRRELEYFTIKESDLMEISLGSWFAAGMFLNKTESGVKFFYFADGELVEENYKSLCFIDDDNAVFEYSELSSEGKKQYCIFDLCDCYNPFDDCKVVTKAENHSCYCEKDGIVSLYARVDGFSEFFIKVYEGNSLIIFSNAVLEQDEKGTYSLYGVENQQLVLWGQGVEGEWDDSSVRLDNLIWEYDEIDVWFLVNNPSIIEDEPETIPEPEPENLIVPVEICPARKWWQFWK